MRFVRKQLSKRLVLVLGALFMPSYVIGQAISLRGNDIYELRKEGFINEVRIDITSKFISEEKYKSIQRDLEKLKRKKYSKRRILSDLEIGVEQEFFVRDVLNASRWLTKSGKLVLSKNSVNVWVELEAYEVLAAKMEFRDFLQTLQDRLFENTYSSSVDPSLGILEILNKYVGEFPNVDGDNVLDIFLLDIEDNFEETGGFVAGFFDPVNLIDHEFSNQSDLIYIDLFPTLFNEEDIFIDRTLSTLAHEAQHLIHAGYEGDRPETVFANEGFSEVVEILCGFTPRNAQAYLESPLRVLTSWNYDNPIPDYSRASLWTHYIVEQFGDKILKELVQSPLIGVNAYDEAFKKRNTTFLEVFQNWGVALSINNLSFGTEFGYQHPLRRNLSFEPLYSSNRIPDVINGKVPSLTHALFSYPLTKKLEIKAPFSNSEGLKYNSFSSYPEDGISEIELNLEKVEIVEASNNPHGTISFLASNLNIESKDSTLTPVNLKVEGEKSGIQQKWKYGDGINDIFYLNASYLTLDSFDEKLGVVFSSKKGYWLESISLKSVYLSELSGTGVNAGEERDFELAIYTYKKGEIVEEIVSPQKVSQRREIGKLIAESISLESYYSKLSTLTDSIIVVIGNDSDDNNFIALGMDKSQYNNTQYTIDGSWESLSNKSIGGKPLVGWNPIIHANVIVDQQKEVFTSIIDDISYDFEGVSVKLNPQFEHDSSSINLIIELPDKSFRHGRLISSKVNGYLFEVPAQVNGSYTFIATVSSQNGDQIYRDEKEWEIDFPDGFSVSNNYPNPFNPRTSISFIIIESGTVKWQVFDLLGRKILEIPETLYTSGEYQQSFELQNLSSGVYLIRGILKRERSNETTYRTKKITLIK